MVKLTQQICLYRRSNAGQLQDLGFIFPADKESN